MELKQQLHVDLPAGNLHFAMGNHHFLEANHRTKRAIASIDFWGSQKTVSIFVGHHVPDRENASYGSYGLSHQLGKSTTEEIMLDID